MRIAIRAMCILAVVGAASSFRPADDPPVPVLVELFTSEGCMRCPPADLLLRELASSAPGGGARPVILSEHVDYFNADGWKDPYSQALFTRRQAAYGRGRREPFTPEMIVDGSDSLIGSDREAALGAIARAARRPKPALRLAWRPVSGDLTIECDAGPTAAGARIQLALTQNGLTQQVRAGENTGRQLVHDGVVRQLSVIGSVDRLGKIQQTVAVRPDSRWSGPLRAVVFIQRDGGPVLAIGDTPIR